MGRWWVSVSLGEVYSGTECVFCDVVTDTLAESIEFTNLTFGQCGLVDGHRRFLLWVSGSFWGIGWASVYRALGS